jgi:hypothetical protein
MPVPSQSDTAVAVFHRLGHGRVLTGPIGERINREVALVTIDFRLYHELVPFFAKHGVKLLGLAPGEAVPDSVKAIIGGPAGDSRSTALRQDHEAVWLAAMALVDGRGPARRVTIGVDPGDTIGLAVLVDGRVYWTSEVHSAEDAVARMTAWRTGLDAQEWHLHVGDGARKIGAVVRKLARQQWPDLRVYMVRETSSTPTAPLTGSRHMDAAVYSAIRQP